ncbi:MAG: phospholipid carrier-dependent glycosyltransferase [Chloroflexi bacterium]|nr:phospholipid carrier-dependent glycosyltransferase [Chloroflexota bacterium]MCI0647921.1 phospholipid carrier-dependent glycosyltransferase [Chloroflexota bacterium]MCI0727172.1 phospholipid carrier-dependent glycosyltransferase [Chloroflexota bacterium]
MRPTWLVVPAVLLFFFLVLDSLVGDSPTMDEQNHLARGLAWWRTGDPRLSLEHPPLVNALSALPVLALPGIRLPTDHPSWNQPEGWYAFAEQLLWVYNHDVTRMIFLARLPIVFLTLGLALVAYCFANQLWGRPAGLITFYLLLFDPNILAHGRYTTTDVGGTAFLFLAVFLLWRLWQMAGWQWRRVLAAGLGLGLAFGSKLSTLTFVPILGLMALWPPVGQGWYWRAAGRRLLQLGLAGLLSLPVLWLIFALEWGPFRFQTPPLAALNQASGPMPTFWAGIEQIVRLSGGGRPSFLLGRFSDSGFVAYFPVAFLVKTPLPALLLFLVAAGLLLKDTARRGRAAFLLLPAVLYFLLSIQSALNIGYRHLLPMLPFLYTLAGGLFAPGVIGQMEQPKPLRRTDWLRRAVLAVALAGLLLADLFIHPHYLSYFNLLAGGPANGYNVLIDSNVDWGQDLLRLQEWMAANDVTQVKLAWFGTADPAYYGIAYEPLPGLPRHFDLWWELPFDPADPAPGIYAISASNLWELPLAEKTVFPWFRAREPDGRVGYSILIYHVR